MVPAQQRAPRTGTVRGHVQSEHRSQQVEDISTVPPPTADWHQDTVLQTPGVGDGAVELSISSPGIFLDPQNKEAAYQVPRGYEDRFRVKPSWPLNRDGILIETKTGVVVRCPWQEW